MVTRGRYFGSILMQLDLSHNSQICHLKLLFDILIMYIQLISSADFSSRQPHQMDRDINVCLIGRVCERHHSQKIKIEACSLGNTG
jgi:hypothetical protein